jgi:drug/metabolite transporter (DMT)-like permease
MASILNGTVPLFTIVIAHFWLHDEKITLPRVAGLVVGFAGVVVLVGPNLRLAPMRGNLWGQLAVLLAAGSYALAATFSRKHLRGQPPLMQATMVVLIADMLMGTAALSVERPFHIPALPLTWIALAWLGLLGSCLAYLLYFYLINTWGPTRASLVSYIFPVVGLLLGVIFLSETAGWRLMVGSSLVVAGIVIVNLKLRLKAARITSPAR